MIIYKSLFRKKTTKIYLVIVTCLILAIGTLLIGRNHYITEGNKNYTGSSLRFKAQLNAYDKIKSMPNLKSVKKGISRHTEKNHFWSNSDIVFYIDPSLHDKEAIVWESFVKDAKTLTVESNDKQYTFDVKSTYSGTSNDQELISESAFNQLYDGKESIYYLVELNNWFDNEKSIEWITDNIEVYNSYINPNGEIVNEGNGIEQHEKSKENAPLYFFYVKIFTFLTIVLGIIFVIVLGYTLINIIIDEKKSSDLLSHLGYHKKRLALTTIGKIAIIIILPLLISSIVLIPIYIIW